MSRVIYLAMISFSNTFDAALARLRRPKGLRESFENVRFTPGLVLIAGYCLCYFILIWKTNGIPYASDNNETFSALNHAYNLWNFDFFRSFGLADEAQSPDPAAHPFVHTHQGNFPRLFSFFLYVLGARSAESQIWITTFTVGAASILMTYLFFRRVAGTLFAVVAVLLLMTDYLLFAQWQVNTYRVWHGFFFFGSLLCAYGLAEWKRSYWIVATVCLYACLFYWELVFVAFTALTAGLYTAQLYWRRPRLVFFAFAVQGAGAMLGLAVLITQLVLYLGWQDFLTDIQLTFMARNRATENTEFLSALKSFYDKRNVVFIFNLRSEIIDLGALAFLRSLFQNVAEIPTPLLSLLCLSLAASSLCADSRLPDQRDATEAGVPFASTAGVLLVPAVFAVIMSISDGTVVFGSRRLGAGSDLSSVRLAYGWTWIGVVFFFSIALAVGLRAFVRKISLSGAPPGLNRYLRTFFFLFGLSAFIGLQGYLYENGHRILWHALLPIPLRTAQILTCSIALLGCLIVLAGRRTVMGSFHHIPSTLIPFFLCGSFAYLVINKLSGGYVYTGYLSRFCPLPVFLFDAVLALGVVTAIAVARTFQQKWRAGIGDWTTHSMTVLAAFAGFAFVCCWGFVQAQYVRLFPPTQLEFLNQFKKLGVTGDGIMSNNYAVPFGLIANTWGYSFAFSPQTAAVKVPNYMWFADRTKNSLYLRPELYVCWISLDRQTLIRRLADPNDVGRRCSELPIVAQAAADNDEKHSPRLKVLGRDRQKDLWAILQLEWDSSGSPRR